MLFLAVGRFKPGTAERRAPLQAEFSAHLEQRALRIKLFGPLLDEAGIHSGVFLILDAPDEASTSHLIAMSPFTTAGVYQSVEITRIALEGGRLD